MFNLVAATFGAPPLKSREISELLQVSMEYVAVAREGDAHHA